VLASALRSPTSSPLAPYKNLDCTGARAGLATPTHIPHTIPTKQALRQTFSNLPFLLEQAELDQLDFGFGEDGAEGGAIIDSTQGVRSRTQIGTVA